MVFDYKERTVKVTVRLPLGGQGQFLHPTSGAQTPYTLCKNLWEFELDVKIIGRRYRRFVSV